MAPSSNQLYFTASALWVYAWWHIDISGGHPVTLGVSVLYSVGGLMLAILAVRAAVPHPSPFKSTLGQLLWAVRPRTWVLCWLGIILTVEILGAPLFLWNYGGGRCEYFDWFFQIHVLPAQGDGSFAGCRFLWSR